MSKIDLCKGDHLEVMDMLQLSQLNLINKINMPISDRHAMYNGAIFLIRFMQLIKSWKIASSADGAERALEAELINNIHDAVFDTKLLIPSASGLLGSVIEHYYEIGNFLHNNFYTKNIKLPSHLNYLRKDLTLATEIVKSVVCEEKYACLLGRAETSPGFRSEFMKRIRT